MIKINKTTESDDSIIRRWEMAGLLEEVPDDKKADVAHLLHSALLFIIGSMSNQLRDDTVTEELCGMLIPAVRKIYDINECVAINFTVLQTMLEETLTKNTPKVSGYGKIKMFFSKISLFNSGCEVVDPLEITIAEVAKKYTLKFCSHGKRIIDYCTARNLPCDKIHESKIQKRQTIHIKLCEHGKGITDYCLPCDRVNNA